MALRIRCVALLALVVALLAPAQAPAAPDPCLRVAALYQSGYYAEAEKEYERLLGVDSCVALEPVKTARAAAKKEAAPTSDDRIAEARKLQDLGFDAEARDVVKSIIKDNPKADVPGDLRSIDQRLGFWHRLFAAVVPWLRFAAEILIILLGVGVLVLLAFTLVNGVIQRFKLSARIKGFTGSTDATLPAVLTSSLSAVIAQLKDQKADAKVQWQSATEASFGLSTNITNAFPQVGLIAGLIELLDKLFFRRMVVVSGTMHPINKARGAGLTLTLANRRGHILAETTVWENDFGLLPLTDPSMTDSVRYERMIVPAAVWLGYQKDFGFKPANAPLQTQVWSSYALFALGELAPESVQRMLYERALDRDDGNLGARLNLATLLLTRPIGDVPGKEPPSDDPLPESWAHRLVQAERHLTFVVAATGPETAVWYRALYLRAARSIYARDGAAAIADLDEISTAASTHGNDVQLRPLLESLGRLVPVLRLMAEFVNTGAQGQIPESDWRSGTGEYNLAGLWSRWSSASPTAEVRRDRTRKALEHLRSAITRREGWRAEATVDPDFDPIRSSEVFKELVEEPESVPAADAVTHYAVTLDPGPELMALAKGPAADD